MDTKRPLGLALHDIARDFRYIFDVRARGLGVTRSQWRALLYLSRVDGPTQTELADSLEVERISAGRMVDRLVENGLIERRADPGDRRVWRLHLLPAAHNIVSELSSIAEKLEAEALSIISPDEQEHLFGLLKNVGASLKRLKSDFDCKKEVA